MLSWLLSSSCPVPPDRKGWIEQGLNWLCREFGRERMLRRQFVLPTSEYFPDPYDKSPETVEHLFARVCGHMEVNRQRVKLQVFRDAARTQHAAFGEGVHERAAGLYSRESLGWETIAIEESQLDDPMTLVGTMAHELAHVHLIGDRRLNSELPDHEPLTDLLTVLYGLGIFTANAMIRESTWRGAGSSGWSVGRQGYLTGPEYGYAFALLARERGETSPEWLNHLRLDVRSACKQGLRFLEKSNDSQFLKPVNFVDDFPQKQRAAAPVRELRESDDDRPWTKP